MIPEMSIVTGTRHRPASLKRFLKSIRDTASVPTEVIIADASDTMPLSLLDGDALVNLHVESLEHYHERPRLGTVLGYNAAFRKATGRYVAWFNDDCVLLPGWDRTAIDFMDSHEEVGLGCIYWKDPGGSWYLQSFQSMVYPNFGVFRADVLKQTGGFDERQIFLPLTGKVERLTFYGNDTSAAFLVTDAGYAVCGIPGCKVEHFREQDAERQENYRQHVHGNHGNIAGAVLWQLWNGDPEKQKQFGFEYGYRQLREKYNRFKHLHAPLECN
jgi:hypothetical protein